MTGEFIYVAERGSIHARTRGCACASPKRPWDLFMWSLDRSIASSPRPRSRGCFSGEFIYVVERESIHARARCCLSTSPMQSVIYLFMRSAIHSTLSALLAWPCARHCIFYLCESTRACSSTHVPCPHVPVTMEFIYEDYL